MVWDDLPKYTADGSAPAAYSVAQERIPRYEIRVFRSDGAFSLLNIHEPQITEFRGSIFWAGAPNPEPPEKVAVILWAGDREYRRCMVTEDAAGHWDYLFDDLPMTLGGKKVRYSVTVEGAPGYLREYEGSSIRLYFVPEDHAEEKEEAKK